jgi:hypothetical protein
MIMDCHLFFSPSLTHPQVGSLSLSLSLSVSDSVLVILCVESHHQILVDGNYGASSLSEVENGLRCEHKP